MAKKKSGKVLIVFLVITAILMSTLAAITIFFFQLETDERKAAEVQVEEYVSQVEEFQATIAELEKSNFLFEEKNKEADERINSLLDELELQEGLREEMKSDTAFLREKLELEVAAKDKTRKQITKMQADYDDKIKVLDAKLSSESARFKNLEKKYNALLVKTPPAMDEENIPEQKIIEGKVINVDNETGFVIINIGQGEGIIEGQKVQVFRDEEHIGEIKITRAQSGMSAADPVAPLTIGAIQKLDQVIVK